MQSILLSNLNNSILPITTSRHSNSLPTSSAFHSLSSPPSPLTLLPPRQLILPIPYLPPRNPRLQHLALIAQNTQIGPPALPQHAPASGPIDPHQARHILRHTGHSLRDPAPGPPHQVAHALLQRHAAADQGVGALDSSTGARLALARRNLRVARVQAVRQAGQLDGVGDEDGAARVRAVQQRQRRRVQVLAVRDQRVERRGRCGRGGREADQPG